jgi:molybdenum cofactor cytidylyltransferase
VRLEDGPAIGRRPGELNTLPDLPVAVTVEQGEGGDRRDAGLPVVRGDDGAATVDGPDTVAGVLLAAGTGSRFADGNKLLATVDGEPIVRRAARTLLDAPVDPVVVVTGHEAERVRGALSSLPVRFVHNDDYAAGQATSVRTGVRALVEGLDGESGRDRGAGRASDGDWTHQADGTRRPDTGVVDAAVFALGDMPFVTPATVRALVAAYRAGHGTALAAAYRGERGNPVLFDRRYFDRLAAVEGDVGGRELLVHGDDSALVETGDPGVRRDVDTRTDLSRARDSGGE